MAHRFRRRAFTRTRFPQTTYLAAGTSLASILQQARLRPLGSPASDPLELRSSTPTTAKHIRRRQMPRCSSVSNSQELIGAFSNTTPRSLPLLMRTTISANCERCTHSSHRSLCPLLGPTQSTTRLIASKTLLTNELFENLFKRQVAISTGSHASESHDQCDGAPRVIFDKNFFKNRKYLFKKIKKIIFKRYIYF